MPPMAPAGGPPSDFSAPLSSAAPANQRSVMAAITWIWPGASWSSASRRTTVASASPN